jgi:hypothetical protein
MGTSLIFVGTKVEPLGLSLEIKITKRALKKALRTIFLKCSFLKIKFRDSKDTKILNGGLSESKQAKYPLFRLKMGVLKIGDLVVLKPRSKFVLSRHNSSGNLN